MTNRKSVLNVGASAVALFWMQAAFSSPASAQTASSIQAASSPPVVEEVVVTGTSIRGVSPVGSNVMAVGQADIEKMGVANVTQVLANVPSLMFFGNAGRSVTQGANGQPGITVGIHQIGAMSSATTLVLIDGHHALESGNSNYFVNPNQLPPNMIERVEVLADGASAVYGSDAVATRRGEEETDDNVLRASAQEVGEPSL